MAESSHIETLKNFDINSIPDLDVVVLAALELFQQKPLSKLELDAYKLPLVVGSGNAVAAGQIIFRDTNALYASESDVEEKLKFIKDIDEVVLLSASGGKHAPIIARTAQKYGKHVTLITNTPDSPASKVFAKPEDLAQYIYPKNREPYTYNASTYMGMILSETGEDPAEIEKYLLDSTDKLNWPEFGSYNKYYLIIPPQFSGIIRMLHVKFIELFGRNIARDIETSENVRHATTVAPSDELFISFGEENTTWGKPENRFYVPLPENAGYGAMMAVGYYTISQIQKSQPQYFKENIATYTEMVSKIFNEEIKPIVEGN